MSWFANRNVILYNTINTKNITPPGLNENSSFFEGGPPPHKRRASHDENDGGASNGASSLGHDGMGGADGMDEESDGSESPRSDEGAAAGRFCRKRRAPPGLGEVMVGGME